MSIKQQCPAKVNLFLEVTGKRPDGYHKLATLFAKINVYDVLDFKFARSESQPMLALSEEPGAPQLSVGEDNLVLRAARAFYKTFRVKVGVRITLTKRIPMGAGLGGGSSDAAGTLLGLAKLFEIELHRKNKDKLHRLGVALGADVPFFLRPEPFCLGTGIGDRLKGITIAKSLPYMVLAYPAVHISTVEAFKALPKPPRADVLTRLSHLDKLVRGLKAGRPVEEWGGLLFNRLEQSELPALRQVEQARRILGQLGARGVRMSGSGSSVFGFVSSHVEGEEALKRLQGYPWKVFLTSCQG